MAIYVNQVGYDLTQTRKTALATQAGTYGLLRADGTEVLRMQAMGYEEEQYLAGAKAFADPLSGEDLYLLDFSGVSQPGVYHIEGPLPEKAQTGDSEKEQPVKETGLQIEESIKESSFHFAIREQVLRQTHNAMVKAFYFQRCGCALDEKYAGPFRHKKCHTETAVVWGETSNVLDAPGGWHDAGDYGRYVTAGAVAAGHLLYAYECYPDAFRDELCIPESGNGMADVLNECRYELEWLLKMQRTDGGVYHKLTAWHHAPFIMPEDDHDLFYAYPVSSMAVGDFVAITAMAARVYRKDPAFSARLSQAAWRSYEWLLSHPEPLLFRNPEDSGTGSYMDRSDLDERYWAQAEMLLLAEEEGQDTAEHLKRLTELWKKQERLTGFGWGDVSGFATMTLLLHGKKHLPEEMTKALERAVREEARQLLAMQKENAFFLSMRQHDFFWGSSMTVMNRGILMALAYELAKQKDEEEEMRELETAIYSQMDYLLGKNAANYSFVTGFGENAYRHPHLRTVASDDVEEAIPGFVSGGPNGHPGDEPARKQIPAGTPPMKCYLDKTECYSLNEVAIYWNSSACFVSAFLNRK